MKKNLLSLLGLVMTISCLQAQTITEFHYDNAGGDVNEFVEVIVPADGCTYTIEFYNGSNGSLYATEAVPACTTPEVDICATGAAGCIFAVLHNGIQNGGSDGFALVQDCAGTVAVIEFLSYEGTLTPTEGAAMGMTSVDVGVSESSGTAIGSSITVAAGVGTITTETPGACSEIALAITLTHFDAISKDEAVMLEWSTENETNNDFFVVEHSLDGRNFEELKSIEGAGTTTEKMAYEFMHENVATGLNYYRLTQVDFDGRSSISDIKSVEVKATNTISVSPTLVNQEINIQLGAQLQNDTQINVVDITGQMVLQASFGKDNSSKVINVADLTSGAYFLILNIDGDIQSKKFMKL